MVCDLCADFYLVASRLPRVCRPCEAKAIQNAAKQVDDKGWSLSECALLMMVGRKSLRKVRRCWQVK